jgi:hypothetical protein
MANVNITPTIIAKEALVGVINSMVAANLVHREFKNEFLGKVGGTVNIRKPVQFVVGTTEDITSTINDVKESYTSVTVDKFANVAWKFIGSDLTMAVEKYRERYIQPAVNVIANKIDMDVLDMYKYVYNAVGTPGVTPGTYLSVGQAQAKLHDLAVARDNRRLIMDADAELGLADGLKGLFLQDTVREIVRAGQAPKPLAGFECYMDQNVKYHTAGVKAGTPLVALGTDTSMTGAAYTTLSVAPSATAGLLISNQSVLYTDGWSYGTSTLLEGDIITIAGVYSVNPVSKQSTGKLQQFVVSGGAGTIGSSGQCELTVSPAIIGPAGHHLSTGLSTTALAYQTVSAMPVSNAAITQVASHRANLAFQRNALALVTVPMELPDSCSFKARETFNGLSIRVVKAYDILTNYETIRLDVMYGTKCINPAFATRLMG